MVEIKRQYPFIDDNGNARADLEKHYTENENGERFYIKQVETEIIYAEAVDVYPCKYTYEATEEKIEQPQNAEGENL